MREYPKINSIFKRDERGRFIEGAYSCDEFGYLSQLIWIGTEKIDGTNIRIGWDGIGIEIGGRTDNAQIPTFLLGKLNTLFAVDKLAQAFLDHLEGEEQTILYGEGYGAKIQKGGGNYISAGVDFILFDVKVGDWWLKRDDIEDVGVKLGVRVVPVVFEGTFDDAILSVKSGIKSTFGDFEAEGIVLKPQIELRDRAGRRIITKLKHKDFGSTTG